jgi:hypothetical protein
VEEVGKIVGEEGERLDQGVAFGLVEGGFLSSYRSKGSDLE